MAQEEKRNDGPETTLQIYGQALRLGGYGYLEQEKKLRDRAGDAANFLRRRAMETSDAFDRFTAATLADWVEGKPEEYAAVMTQLDALDRELKNTPLGAPRPDVVASIMTSVAADRLVSILALRLVKRTLVPAWLEMGTLLYLEQHPRASVLPAIERYAAVTQARDQRQLALEIVEAIKSR